MTYQRDIAERFKKALTQYPVVTLTGPRQSGKTTLARTLCPNYDYINLEEPDIREAAIQDPRAILSKYQKGLIIDEVQHVPSLLSYIQAIVDEKQQDGMYVLTGSHQIALHEALAQSLAGRTALLHLLPLCLHELSQAGIKPSLNELLIKGFYPRVYQKELDPTQAYRDYVKTYLERDVRSMINVKDLLMFQRFLKLSAARTGCVLNMNGLANDVGVSNHTIKHWLSVLQASHLVELIMPYYENFGKQVVKSPKLYFTDVGLVCHLIGIETISQVDRDPLRGNLFETLVVTELMKTRYNIGRDPNLYYYRDSLQKEVDIIYKRGSSLIPVEIKSAQTMNISFTRGLDYFHQLVGERCEQAYVVYAGEQELQLEKATFLNYQHVPVITE